MASERPGDVAPLPQPASQLWKETRVVIALSVLIWLVMLWQCLSLIPEARYSFHDRILPPFMEWVLRMGFFLMPCLLGVAWVFFWIVRTRWAAFLASIILPFVANVVIFYIVSRSVSGFPSRPPVPSNIFR
ncbi:MAG: hypothetical protein EXR98_19000 [Gemmataceae bacterium]|nr:hypothetical protein [Gemmataceae bacterium]